MKAIIYSRSQGGVSVVYPAPGARLVSGMQRAGLAIRFVSAVSLDQLDGLLTAGFEPEFAESEDQFAIRVAEEVRELGAEVVLLDASALPDDRTFRNAWKLVDGAILVDMEQARALQLTALRKARNDLLRATDRIAQRALEQVDKTEFVAIAALRQRLRDMPSAIAPLISEARSPAQLQAVCPSSILDARRVLESEIKLVGTV
ncbi:hypothetical protein [Desertibaculum subflavum]|uniref:hypothetical protein n=1 Tax=Desertibaculum subflavum TaxID=2268458 RepID=UPI000E6701F4